MDVPEIEFATVPQFLHSLTSYPHEAWIYRGESDISRPIIPKAGRPQYYSPKLDDPDLQESPPPDICRFNHWRKLAIAYHQSLPENDFDCLAFAQHYGLATRLLDWTENPLVALFFAVDSCSKNVGVVYCYSSKWHLDSRKLKIDECPNIAQFTPPPFDRRILVQSGVLTYHPDPSEPLVPESVQDLDVMAPEHGLNLVRFTIKSGLKPLVKRQLNHFGINRKTLFPDIEGLSNFINWETEYNANPPSYDDLE